MAPSAAAFAVVALAAAAALAAVPVAAAAASTTQRPLLLRGDAAAAALGAAAASQASSAAAAAAATAAAPDARPPPPPAWKISTRPPAEIADLQRTLRLDRDLVYSPSADALIYVCSLGGGNHNHSHSHSTSENAPLSPPLDEERVSAAAAPSAAVGGGGGGFVFPLDPNPSTADAFKLHSRPNAARKIVLDFTGHVTRPGTIWRLFSQVGDVPIVTPPWDLDGNPTSFSNTERAAIIAAWRQVAEDFAAWYVDVTTEEPPGTDDQGDASLGNGVGVRVVIGPYTGGWLGGDGFGGIGMFDSFGSLNAGPVVFCFNLHPFDVAGTATHELGHALGLKHHGNYAAPEGTVERFYYGGHGDWAPTMGSSYTKPMQTWARGDYPYATQPGQDDLALISARLDAAPWLGGGKDAASAEALAPPPDAAKPTSVVGVFASRKHQKFYRFKAGKTGAVTLSLTVASNDPGNWQVRTRLSAQIRVWRAETGTDVGLVTNTGPGGIDRPTGSTVANLALDVAAGVTYVIEISAARSGNTVDATGYTEYGSAGTYALSLRQSAAGVVVDAGAAAPNALARCSGLALLDLSREAGNCETGWAVRAEDVLVATSNAVVAASTAVPPLGTVVAAGTSQLLSVSLPDGGSCSTRVSVAPCVPLGDYYTITCPPVKAPYAKLAAPNCATAAINVKDLYRVWKGTQEVFDVRPNYSIYPGDVLPAGKFTLPMSLGLGDQTDSPDQDCLSTVEIQPCAPVAATIGNGPEFEIDNDPGTCLVTPWAEFVFTPESLSWTIETIRARAKPTGPIVPFPLKPGKYFFEAVYPGGIVVATNPPRSVNIKLVDVEAPKAQIKPAVARNAGGGFICAKGASRQATAACVSIAGILNVADNCGASGLTRKFTCAGAGCPRAAVRPTATTLCVPVRAGGGRVEATFSLVAADKRGNKAPALAIPIAGYHFSDAAPAGSTCYKA